MGFNITSRNPSSTVISARSVINILRAVGSLGRGMSIRCLRDSKTTLSPVIWTTFQTLPNGPPHRHFLRELYAPLILVADSVRQASRGYVFVTTSAELHAHNWTHLWYITLNTRSVSTHHPVIPSRSKNHAHYLWCIPDSTWKPVLATHRDWQ